MMIQSPKIRMSPIPPQKQGAPCDSFSLTTSPPAAKKKITSERTQDQLIEECNDFLEAIAPDKSKDAVSLEEHDGSLLIDGVRLKINGGDGTSSIQLII